MCGISGILSPHIKTNNRLPVVCSQMTAVGITENVKGDVKKFEIWYNAREEVYIIQVGPHLSLAGPALGTPRVSLGLPMKGFQGELGSRIFHDVLVPTGQEHHSSSGGAAWAAFSLS